MQPENKQEGTFCRFKNCTCGVSKYNQKKIIIYVYLEKKKNCKKCIYKFTPNLQVRRKTRNNLARCKSGLERHIYEFQKYIDNDRYLSTDTVTFGKIKTLSDLIPMVVKLEEQERDLKTEIMNLQTSMKKKKIANKSLEEDDLARALMEEINIV